MRFGKLLTEPMWMVLLTAKTGGAIRKDYLKRDYRNQEDAYDAIREMLEKLRRSLTPVSWLPMSFSPCGLILLGS